MDKILLAEAKTMLEEMGKEFRYGGETRMRMHRLVARIDKYIYG